MGELKENSNIELNEVGKTIQNMKEKFSKCRNSEKNKLKSYSVTK
jgi:hypothetical protein